MYGNAVYKEGGKSTLRILDCRGEGPTESEGHGEAGLEGARRRRRRVIAAAATRSPARPAPVVNPPLAGPLLAALQ